MIQRQVQTALLACLGLAPTQLHAADTPQREPRDLLAGRELPRYVFFNKAPGQSGPHGWRQDKPETFTPESCREIVQVLGTPGHDRLRVGVSFPFSIIETDVGTLGKSITNLLDAACETGVPVLITLDGQNWWETRSDLWNFWDPKLPGFDPANRHNVEWTDWGPEHAVKIGWRNWGRQIRVRPAPNLASPAFLNAHMKAYDTLVPLIARWYRTLPADRKHLFGGLKVGWEASINVNAYYYADGNRIFEQSPGDASNDPTGHDPKQGWTFGQPPLGHAAVFTAGIRKTGQLTKGDIEQVVAQYLERLSRAAHRRGIPRHLIFTHQGGTYTPWDEHLSFRPAMNAWSIPGWSFYSHNPGECGSLAADLEAAGREQWAAAEWWRGAADTAGWLRNFRETLDFKDCRFVCVYNWHPFSQDANAVAAVRRLVAETATTPSR